MITLSFANKPERQFNLKTRDREQQLYFAWKAMRSDIKFAHKFFFITPDTGEPFKILVNSIADCFYENKQYDSSRSMLKEGMTIDKANSDNS